MTQKQLDLADVDPAFEQMRREAVPQPVCGDLLGDARLAPGPLEELVHGGTAEGLLGILPRKQPVPRLVDLPVLTEYRSIRSRNSPITRPPRRPSGRRRTPIVGSRGLYGERRGTLESGNERRGTARG